MLQSFGCAAAKRRLPQLPTRGYEKPYVLAQLLSIQVQAQHLPANGLSPHSLHRIFRRIYIASSEIDIIFKVTNLVSALRRALSAANAVATASRCETIVCGCKAYNDFSASCKPA